MPSFSDLFRAKPRYVTVKPPRSEEKKPKDIPDGLWLKCENCESLLYKKEIERNLRVCPNCGFHYKVSARERIEQLTDPGSFAEFAADLESGDPIGFPEYPEKLKAAQEKTGLREGVLTGDALLDGYPVVLAAMDFGFIGGSMGSVVGEKVTLAIERATESRRPLVIVATSGGARMQEGILSLMQMAKTAAALGRLARQRVPYFAVLANPCTAGVMASFASLGDVIIAEPGAVVAFAGPRVIAQTVREKMPPGSHRSEFMLEHGFVDLIVDRRELKHTLSRLLVLHGASREVSQ
ncbi:MAG TPA: acetyl-CoA carboxylase carboxyltransferase subunit beta [Firmicutes bacterium]|nr:acetyl-CoA carboxylase carboxyltransferase subunit beta [Bacillota bacterium]